METVEVVIRIPKYAYDMTRANHKVIYADNGIIGQAIIDGTVLPKGHGRMIDADNMKRINAIQMGDFNSIESIRKWIDIMPTVVEADEESEDKE